MYNKIDVCSMEEVDEIARRPYSIPISCSLKLNFDGLLAKIWDMMVGGADMVAWLMRAGIGEQFAPGWLKHGGSGCACYYYQAGL